MAGDHGFGIEVEAVASYRWRSLLVGARDHNALTLCWFRTPANFQTCSTPPNDVFTEFDESHALVAVASNGFHRLGVSIDPTTQTGEANGSRHGEMSRDRTRHPHRSRHRSQELRCHAGLFRSRLLPDLPERA